jgi:hypothetical protein
MFANTQMGGMDLGFPDICKIPPIAIPIPFPDIALGPLGVPAVYNVLFMATPAHNLLTFIPITFGDTPGLMLGLISQTVMAQSRPILGSFRVLVGGLPATRMTTINIQNLFNSPGMRIVPSQIKVIILA